MNKFFLLSALIVVISLSGCVTTSRSSAPDSLIKSRSENSSDASLLYAKSVDITPLSAYSDDWEKGDPAGSDFSDSYTRLLITSSVNEVSEHSGRDLQKAMEYEPRRWISRALVDRNYSINLAAKVSAGSFEATVPLATISHESGSQGEQWIRSIHHTKRNFPLFLVSAHSSAATPTVRIMVNGDRSYSSRAAAAAVQVAINVAQITGRTSQVITALSSDDARNQARAMDEAISKLFSSGLTEEHWSDRDLRYWNADGTHRPRGARVSFDVPSDTRNWNSPPLRVGEWTITFDYPRPSIFADWRICGAEITLPRCASTKQSARAKVLQEINAGAILNYPMTEGTQGLGTIRAYLSQKDWFIASQVDLSDPKKRENSANALCRMIINEITGIGLNGFDAHLVVWAVANGMPIQNVHALYQAKDCRASLSMVDAERKGLPALQ